MIRKNNHLKLFLCIFSLILVPCSLIPPKQSVNTGPTSTVERELTRSDFDFLRYGMSYDDVVAKIGEPTKSVTFGFPKFVYDLKDGSEVFLSYSTFEHLDYAEIKYPNGITEIIVDKEKK